MTAVPSPHPAHPCGGAFKNTGCDCKVASGSGPSANRPHGAIADTDALSADPFDGSSCGVPDALALAANARLEQLGYPGRVHAERENEDGYGHLVYTEPDTFDDFPGSMNTYRISVLRNAVSVHSDQSDAHHESYDFIVKNSDPDARANLQLERALGTLGRVRQQDMDIRSSMYAFDQMWSQGRFDENKLASAISRDYDTGEILIENFGTGETVTFGRFNSRDEELDGYHSPGTPPATLQVRLNDPNADADEFIMAIRDDNGATKVEFYRTDTGAPVKAWEARAIENEVDRRAGLDTDDRPPLLRLAAYAMIVEADRVQERAAARHAAV